MKTKDLFPYNSFTLGINNKYLPMPDKRILIHSKEVLASNSTIILGKHYILIMSLNQELNVQVVEPGDVFFDGTLVHLNLIGQNNNEMIFLKTRLTEDDSYSTQDWLLLDSNSATQIIEKLEVLDYCIS